jgi:enamine deaminase RidA (YjgF/YER057c/UK114 family)
MHNKLHPSDWLPAKGYANGIVATGTTIYLGGQIGWNAQQQFESDDFIVQTKQTLLNIAQLLSEANATPAHLVRLTWFVTSRSEYLARLPELGTVYREVFGRNFPAMSCLEVSGLMEARAKVEIEATAVIPAIQTKNSSEKLRS